MLAPLPRLATAAAVPPDPTRYYAIRAGFVAQGTSLRAWCIAAGVSYSDARKALDGRRNGPKARALAAQIEAASRGA
jgi:lambda repressor-like predicted transcriptional regulator